MATPTFGRVGTKGTTPGRQLTVIVDEYLPSLICPLFLLEKQMAEIGESADAAWSNVVFHPRIGWHLRSQTLDPDVGFDDSNQQHVLTLSGGFLTTPTQVKEEAGMASGLLLIGGSVNGPMLQKKKTSVEAWSDCNLPADQASYPGPWTGSEPNPMDRIAVSVADHNPGDELRFIFSAVDATGSITGYVCAMGFSGPLYGSVNTSSGGRFGTGQYYLGIKATGLAVLWARLAARTSGAPSFSWQRIDDWQIADRDSIFNSPLIIVIHSHGTKINISAGGARSSLSAANVRRGVLGQESRPGAQQIDNPNVHTYTVPSVMLGAQSPTKVRVDIARTHRMKFQVARGYYPANGYIEDIFETGLVPVGADPIEIDYYADIPAGTAVNVRLWRVDTDAEITAISSATYGTGGYSRFPVPTDNPRQYRVRFEMAPSPDGFNTPTFTRWVAYRPEQTDIPAVTPWILALNQGGVWRRFHRNLSIDYGGKEISASMAQIEAHDLDGSLAFFRQSGQRPFRIIATLEDGVTTSVLFHGYARKSRNKVKKRRNGKPYPSENWHSHDIPVIGQWARAATALANQRYSWIDPATGTPFKVTDRIRVTLNALGYPASMVDVPDLPVRLFAADAGNMTEPQSSMMELAKSDSENYLSSYVDWDPNAGAVGMWRLIQPPALPYQPLAQFVSGVGYGGLRHLARNYPDVTVGAATIPVSPYIYGTISNEYEPPAGNCVVVMGGADLDTSSRSGESSAARLTQTLYRFESCNFFQLAPSHPAYPMPLSPDGSVGNGDYMGYAVPIWVYDLSLASKAAVNWVAIRVYLNACFGRRIIKFQAPLKFVWDPADTYQTRPRPLRHYDPVLWEDQETGVLSVYLVRDVKITARKAHLMMAEYEIVQIDWPDSYQGLLGRTKRMDELIRDSVRVNSEFASAAGLINNFRNAVQSVTFSQVPITNPPIQNWDASSINFGQIQYTPDWNNPYA